MMRQGYHHHPQTLEEVRTLWIGDLQYWVDENYLSSCFSQTGELVSVKVIRNKITGQPEGYGFIEFISHPAAERTLQTFNATPMPGTEINFRLNWASSFGSRHKVDPHSIFVGDLAPHVTDYLLQQTFRVRYSSVRGAKVVTDPCTGRSKGYGFVKFAEESERNRAMAEMNGLYCSTRPMRISAATPKKPVGLHQPYKAAYPVLPAPSAVAATVPAQFLAPENDITCTTDGFVAGAEQEVYDPMATPDVDNKTGDESMRNGDVMNEDRISELPEALLLDILSSVPTKDVIATSVLSKRWRSLWKMVPKLKFNSETEDVYRLLLLHKAPFLESLHLQIEDTKGRLDIGILVGIAFSRHVRELVLDLYNEDHEIFQFPSVLCSFNNTLEVLKLMHHVHLDFPSRVCLNALRELHLHLVDFENEATVCNLLSGCPKLQEFVLERINNADVETFTIAVPSLQRLTIDDDIKQDMPGGGFVINAPSLKYLNIQSLFFNDFFLLEIASEELVEAKIGHIPPIANENIIASITRVKRLSLYLPLKIKFPTGSIFYRLVFLELSIKNMNGWNQLSLVLDSSPKLQTLKLDNSYREDCPVGWEWNHQSKCVPECLMLHLETLVWTDYKWQREDDKQVATYILKNARKLKKATFSTSPWFKMASELASVVRASESCHLVFESI